MELLHWKDTTLNLEASMKCTTGVANQPDHFLPAVFSLLIVKYKNDGIDMMLVRLIQYHETLTPS